MEKTITSHGQLQVAPNVSGAVRLEMVVGITASNVVKLVTKRTTVQKTSCGVTWEGE